MEEMITKLKGEHKYTIQARIKMNVCQQGSSSCDDSSKYLVSLAESEWLVDIVEFLLLCSY